MIIVLIILSTIGLITIVRAITTIVINFLSEWMEQRFDWHMTEWSVAKSIQFMVEEIDTIPLFAEHHIGANGMKNLILSKIEKHIERLDEIMEKDRRYCYELSTIQKIRVILKRLFDSA